MSEIPFCPDEDPVISAVTKEVKEAYERGHDKGYRMAIHDVEVWLHKIGKHQLARKILIPKDWQISVRKPEEK